MFLFNSNHGNDPISFPDHPFFHFPSLNFDDQDLLLQQPQYSILLHHQHHYHQQQQHQPLDETPATFLNLNMVDSEYSDMINNVSGIHDNSTGREQQIQRKRSSSKTKRDRHSKINTLRGPRDRRMRLSLPVAREFFGLQDMLGVDKASKTVEWLLLQAKHAISKLSREQSCHDGSGDGEGGSAAARSTSSISDSEVVSGIDETVIGKGNKRGGYQKSTTAKEKRGRLTRKTAFHPLARECREKARARARARTQEKQQLQITQNLNEPKPMDHHHHHLESTKQDLSKITSSWSIQIETGEESAGTHIEDQRMFDDQDHDSLMIMGRWSPSNSINQSLRCGVFAELAKLFIIDDYDLPHIRI